MFKFIDYTGLLTAPITAEETVLPITVPNKVCLEIMSSEDFTIFKISDSTHIEYVKVLSCNPDSTVNVERGFFPEYPAVPFEVDACVDGVCCDEVVLDWFVCQSSCLDGVVCDIKTDTDTFFDIHRDAENNCEVIINFLGYTPGVGIDITDDTINVDLCNFDDLVEEDLLSTDEFVVCKEEDLYNLSLADLCSYILSKIIPGGDGFVLGFDLPIINKGTAENPIVGMEEIYADNQPFFGGTVDKFGRVTSVGTGSLPILPDGTFPYATVTVDDGVITNVAAGGTGFGVLGLDTGDGISDTGTSEVPDLDLVNHLSTDKNLSSFVFNKYGVATSVTQVITPGTYAGFDVNAYGIITAYSPPATTDNLVVCQAVGLFPTASTYTSIEENNCIVFGPPITADNTIQISFAQPYNSSNYNVSISTDSGVPAYSVFGRSVAGFSIVFTGPLLATNFYVNVTGYV